MSFSFMFIFHSVCQRNSCSWCLNARPQNADLRSNVSLGSFPAQLSFTSVSPSHRATRKPQFLFKAVLKNTRTFPAFLCTIYPKGSFQNYFPMQSIIPSFLSSLAKLSQKKLSQKSYSLGTKKDLNRQFWLRFPTQSICTRSHTEHSCFPTLVYASFEPKHTNVWFIPASSGRIPITITKYKNN